ncbi:MAG: twin-arginine translocase subunit TatC [Bacteroidota bacterium]|nr:twin-arginine translocase subunit TatC [Bacteroidota bacterium]
MDVVIKEKEMSFLDHLEELRWHIIRAVISIFVFAVIAFVSKDFIWHHLILGPSRPDFFTYRTLCQLGDAIGSDVLCIEQLPFTIQSRQMSGQFTMHISSSFIIGLICAFPYAFWEMWRFISPALYSKEKNLTRGATFFVSLLFLMGIFFGYYVVSPLSINFLANYQVDPTILNEFDITSYVSTLSMLVLACGLMFQLPIIIYFLSEAGIVTPALMRTFRRHAIVVILIVSAIITPPEVISQILIACPLLILYEISIFLSAMVLRRKKKDLIETGNLPSV